MQEVPKSQLIPKLASALKREFPFLSAKDDEWEKVAQGIVDKIAEEGGTLQLKEQ